MADTIVFDAQVGGHPGLRITTDGSRIIKPCLPTELHFYQSVINTNQFKLLTKHVPTFYGTTSIDAEGKEGLILENISNGFQKPNILDIKLGTVLYDEIASEEKKQRMIKAAKETTSLETGLRITGFQVYDTTTQKSIRTDKEYGRALTVTRLPEAMALFFPIRTPIPPPTPSLEAEATPCPAGTKPRLLLPVLERVLGTIKEIYNAVEKTDMRMVAGSLLIVYEGDENALKLALEEETSSVYTVKLIDFAHTKLEQGLGPDQGVLLGLKTTISLLEGRINEVKEAMGSVEDLV